MEQAKISSQVRRLQYVKIVFEKAKKETQKRYRQLELDKGIEKILEKNKTDKNVSDNEPAETLEVETAKAKTVFKNSTVKEPSKDKISSRADRILKLLKLDNL